MAHRFEITNGPSKWDLMLSLLDGDSKNRREVVFVVHEGIGHTEGMHVRIDTLEREDGSGESWNFKGRIPYILRDFIASTEKKIEGHFSTRTRKGHLRLL